MLIASLIAADWLHACYSEKSVQKKQSWHVARRGRNFVRDSVDSYVPVAYVFQLFQVLGATMIRLNQRPSLIENCTHRHTKAVHVTVEASHFLLLHFWSCGTWTDCKHTNIFSRTRKRYSLESKRRYSYQCNRDSAVSFLVCGSSKVATISLSSR